LQVGVVALRQPRPRSADGTSPALAPLNAALLVAARRVPPLLTTQRCKKVSAQIPAAQIGCVFFSIGYTALPLAGFSYGLDSMKTGCRILICFLLSWGSAFRSGAAEDGSEPSFLRDVLPILSKAGCNAGFCHAKPKGQNGFKLSVFAYDPQSDYQQIVVESRGRRVFPSAPSESLILKKPTLAIPHEGGRRFSPDSEFYRVIARWIQNGMPYRHPNEPDLVEITVRPQEQRYAKGAVQPLQVQARYADGQTRDVTRLAEFNSTDKDLATVDDQGRIQVGSLTGEATVIARFLGLVALSRVTVPADRVLPQAAYAALPRNNFIDDLAYAHFEKLGLLPSATCTDGEFMRRASLDAIGTLPRPEDVKRFLDDPSPDKRNQFIDSLLEQPAYADHWAVKWGDLIRPNPFRVGVKSVYVLDEWLRESFRENKPYDRFVREILTAQGSTHRYGPAVIYRDRRDPVDRTTLISQVFLGTRLECAKCHHHPNEKWSQADFYHLAAFFGELKSKGTGVSPPISGSPEYFYHAPGGEVKHPVTGEVMKPKPPDGDFAVIKPGQDPREALADWLCRPDNPFFARALVNRIWGEFFGRGLVDPVDDFRTSNPPSIGPLLDALATDFVRHGYDLKHLMRTLMRSHLYQLSSLPNDTNRGDTKYFSRAYRRRLPAEVLLDAVSAVTGTTESFEGVPPASRALDTWNNRLDSQFMDAFGRPNSSADCPCERDRQSSVVQALHLMNSNELQAKIADRDGRAAALAKGSSSEPDIIRELYLVSYSRFPTEDEIRSADQAFQTGGATRKAAVEDILWALLNSAEFVFNH
jgi:Protein of unknown function (DUF1553)/Protein of unknown function (DUF1549)/Bacterial Ig-like domain (group 2)